MQHVVKTLCIFLVIALLPWACRYDKVVPAIPDLTGDWNLDAPSFNRVDSGIYCIPELDYDHISSNMIRFNKIDDAHYKYESYEGSQVYHSIATIRNDTLFFGYIHIGGFQYLEPSFAIYNQRKKSLMLQSWMYCDISFLCTPGYARNKHFYFEREITKD